MVQVTRATIYPTVSNDTLRKTLKCKFACTKHAIKRIQTSESGSFLELFAVVVVANEIVVQALHLADTHPFVSNGW